MAIIEVPCFRYRGGDLFAPLVLEPGRGPEELIRCPVRRRLYRLTPEERVRQALIWFLREGCGRAVDIAGHLRLGAEDRSLDLAGFSAGGAQRDVFRPNVTVVIFETKRPECDLADHVEQLKTYMLRERCRCGQLFNGRQALWVSLAGDLACPNWHLDWLDDLYRVEERVEQASLAADAHLAECASAFDRACAGDFGALAHLVSQFGRDRSLVFTLSRKAGGSHQRVQIVGPQTGGPDLVTYWAFGVVSRKRQDLPRRDFHSLISICPV